MRAAGSHSPQEGCGPAVVREAVMKVRLRDDPPCCEPVTHSTVAVGCDEVVTGLTGGPLVTLKDRIQDDYDDDGNPQYEWVTVVEDAASTFATKRLESDDRVPETTVEARATIDYSGDWVAHERAVALVDGVVWKIRSVAQLPWSITLVLWRVDDGD